MKVCVHSGHNKSNTKGCGAIGYLDESKENRKIEKKLIKLLKKKGIATTSATVDKGDVQSNLIDIVVKTEKSNADLNISIHFNAFKNSKKDGKIKGVECWIYPNSKATDRAKKICSSIAKLGFTNRGVKESNSLYVIRRTTKPMILIEVCFVDDYDDYKQYKKVGYKNIAKAIADCI